MANNITLNDIIDISVTLSPVVSYRKTLNSALFITNSEKVTKEERIKEIDNLDTLITLGFETTSPEYLALQLYFAQSPSPSKAYLGKKDTSEQFVDAITECRQINYEWYALIILDSLVNTMEKSDIKAVCSYVESTSPETIFCLNLDKNVTEYDNIIEELVSGNYQKTIVQRDISDSNAGKTAISGIIGYSLGYNKKVNKAFTLAYKAIKGIDANEMSYVDLKKILNNNVNVYVKQGYYYSLFRQGTMLNGDRFDEVYYIDMLVNDLRNELMNTLVNNPKVPQTDLGINILTSSISQVLDNYVDIEFIQPGTWLGNSILSLEYGDTLSQGYLILFDDINTQSGSDRVDRVAPNCYICIKLAGAIEYITLGINISR